MPGVGRDISAPTACAAHLFTSCSELPDIPPQSRLACTSLPIAYERGASGCGLSRHHIQLGVWVLAAGTPCASATASAPNGSGVLVVHLPSAGCRTLTSLRSWRCSGVLRGASRLGRMVDRSPTSSRGPTTSSLPWRDIPQGRDLGALAHVARGQCCGVSPQGLHYAGGLHRRHRLASA